MNDLPENPFEPIDDGEASSEETTAAPTGGGGSPMDRLFDGSVPGPDVAELKRQYELPQWLAITSRGIMRVATGDGVPPVAEIVIGGALGAMGSDMDFSNGSDDDGDEHDGAEPANAGGPPGTDV